MAKDFQNDMQCGQFEALLADALDGILTPEASQAFETHSQSCPVCGPMFSEARQGMTWLRGLEEAEPPKNLVHNILAATTIADSLKPEAAQAGVPAVGWFSRLWKSPLAIFGGAAHPRFVTSFAMAFFSLSLTLTLAGVRIKDVAHMDLRPATVKKAVVLQYTQLESRVVKYYENMRVVYEIESRVRELKKAASPAEDEGKPQEQQPKEEKKNKNDSGSGGRPEKNQERLSDLGNGLIACLKTSNEGVLTQ